MMAMRQLVTSREEQLGAPFLAFGFSLPPSSEALLLSAVVRTRVQFIVLTGVAVEVKDFLSVWQHMAA